MNVVRGIVGGALGAIAAAIALRIRKLVRSEGKPLGEAIIGLPAAIADDASRATDAARAAVQDGRDATDRARIEFDEQVARHARRTEGNDG